MKAKLLATRLNAWLRDLTKPTEVEIAARKVALAAEYKQGRLDERYVMLAELAMETQAAREIDEAIKHATPYHPGDVLHAYNQAHKPGYNPISLSPAPAVLHLDFPWLPDNHQLNTPQPQTGAYEIPSPKTEANLAALHELLDGYTEPTVKLEAVPKRHERKR